MSQSDPFDLCRHYVELWQVKNATALGHTREAYLVRGQAEGSTEVALKVTYDPQHAAHAKAGYAYLHAHRAQGAVPVLHYDAQACLMMWVPGKSLLEDMDAGNVARAFEAQFNATCRLLQGRANPIGLRPIADVLAPCLQGEIAGLDQGDQNVVRMVQKLVRRALGSGFDEVALHGDVHVRNILQATGGYVVIDARGLRGPAAFEFAQSFVNPWRLREQIFGKDGMRAHALRVATHLGCGPGEVLIWALANALCHLETQSREGQGRHALNCIKTLLQLLAAETQTAKDRISEGHK